MPIKYNSRNPNTHGRANNHAKPHGHHPVLNLQKLDEIESSLNDVITQLDQVEPRLYDVGTNKGAGELLAEVSANTLGVETILTAMLVDTDAIDSSTNTIEANSTLTSSRLSNCQDWIGTSGGDGSGVKTGVNIKNATDYLETIKDYSFTKRGTQANLMNSASCVAAGTTSSVVDWFSHATIPKKLSFLVSASASITATGYEIWGSDDNSTYAPIMVNGSKTFQLAQTNSAGGVQNTAGGVVVDWGGLRYVKIIVYSLGTYTATVVGMS